jgi:hypothetical protein
MGSNNCGIWLSPGMHIVEVTGDTFPISRAYPLNCPSAAELMLVDDFVAQRVEHY